MARGGLWPTPTAMDAHGSRRATARTDELESNEGVTLLDAVWQSLGVDHDPRHGEPAQARLWPTPVASDSDRSSAAYPGGNPTLAGAAQTWPTPRAADGEAGAYKPPDGGRGENLLHAARSWPTPTVSDGCRSSGGTPKAGQTEHLRDAVRSSWATPTANLARGGSGDASRVDDGRRQLGDQVRAVEPGPLNPAWVEWLMGFPLGWTEPDGPSLISQPPEAWAVEPAGLPRTARGVPERTSRLRCLGNAVVSDTLLLVLREFYARRAT